MSASSPLSGLTAHLDKLIYHDGGSCAPPERRHAFIYYITIQNRSPHTVTLLGRKWVLEYEDGRCAVIEGDKIVGETPRLVSGEAFSYNSYHLTRENTHVHGSFHGVDETGARIHVILPSFAMTIPSA